MPAGNWIVPNKSKLLIAQGLLAAAASGTVKLAYISSSWTPDNTDTGNEVFADVSANEIAAQGGYTAGGVSCGSLSLTLSNGAKFTADPAALTPSGANLPAWRRGVLYFVGTFQGKTNPIIAHFLGDATGIDVPATPIGTPLDVVPAAAGVVTL